MDAEEALLRGEAGEVSSVLLHPVAEPLPEHTGLLVRKRDAVDEDRERAARAHDLTSARSALGWMATPSWALAEKSGARPPTVIGPGAGATAVGAGAGASFRLHAAMARRPESEETSNVARTGTSE
jgi:hypothetical protein